MRLLVLLLLAGAAAAQGGDLVRARAREIRRESGYGAAIDYLERRLETPAALDAYADCCLWGGEEERGLRGLRASTVPARERAEAEIRLLVRLFRHREAAEVAGANGWKEAEEWWGGEAALRDRLEARAHRARWLAALLALLLLGAWALLRRWPSSGHATA